MGDSAIMSSSTNQSGDPTAIKVFSSLMLDQLNKQDIDVILDTQQQILDKLEQANRKFALNNQQSNETLATFATRDFQTYVAMLTTMKQDLDLIHKRIRIVKSKLEQKHPQHYLSAVQSVKLAQKINNPDYEDDEEEEASIKPATTNHHIPDENKGTSMVINELKSKERSSSVSSTTSASMLTDIYQKARNSISSGKDIVSGLLNASPSPTTLTHN